MFLPVLPQNLEQNKLVIKSLNVLMVIKNFFNVFALFRFFEFLT